MKTDKEKYGLVLAGGGGKGGYEIGVWKALKESKTLPIGAVSGTSVGALNAALFAAGDYEKAEQIWLNISKDKILVPDAFSLDKNIERFILNLKPIVPLMNFSGSGGDIMNVLGKSAGALGISALARKYVLNRGGIFSREGLIEIIEKSGILDKITTETMPCYATCYNITCRGIQSFQLNVEGKDKITSILLASSAIPVAFPAEEINGNTYYDGGLPFVGDNVPVRPLYEIGFRKFIVVHLSRDNVESFTNKFKGSEFIHVFPRNSQGWVLDGTFDFDPENAERRIEEGYNDMKHQIEMLNDIDELLEHRNKSAKEIHIYSGKYYRSLDAMLKNSISEPQTLTEDNEISFTDLEDEMTALSRQLAKNKKKMNKFVLDGIAHVSAMDAQMNELHRSKGLKKLWNGISGKNKRLKQGIDSNLINAQRATCKMISKLVETDSIGIELLSSVQRQLQGATMRMGRVLEQHGHEITSIQNDYKEIAFRYGELVLKDQELAGEISNIYSLFFENKKDSNDKFTDMKKEIKKMKDVQELHDWRMNIKYQDFGGHEYHTLDVIEKTVCVASDFFRLTKGKWDDRSILLVKSSLDNLGIKQDDKVRYNDLIYRLIVDERLRKKLFEENGIKLFIEEADDAMLPHYEAVLNSIYKGEEVNNTEGSNLDKWIAGHAKEKTGSADLGEAAPFDVICELLIILLLQKESSGNNVRTKRTKVKTADHT